MKIFSKVHRESLGYGTLTAITEVSPPAPTPTLAMRAFDASLKDGECVVDENLLSVNGWLTSDGDLHACGWLQHDKSVKAFGYHNERDAAKAGVIRLANMKWQIEKRFMQDVLISDKQFTTIQKWHRNNGLDSAYFDHYNIKIKPRI